MKRLLPILAVLLLCLTGCQRGPADPTTTAAPPQTQAPTEKTYAVTFRVLGQKDVTLSVPEGQTLAMPAIVAPGLTISGWLDQNGQSVEPAGTTVTGDLIFEAVTYPDLSSHAPFLFAGEDGRLRPDDTLTADELVAAFDAIAVPEAEKYLPGMPTGPEPVTGELLASLFSHCFPGAIQTPEGEVTRAQFAQLLCQALGREGETVALSDAPVYPDLALTRADAAALLEAAAPHVPDEAGKTILEAFLDRTWEPGFFNLAGWLYHAEEDGTLTRNAKIGTLSFAADGHYTSGDGTLDEEVAAILAPMTQSGGDREEMLKQVFFYVRDLTYVSRDTLPIGATGWELSTAREMLEKGLGNCYYFAAGFWALARGLGYEAVCYSSIAFPTATPHAWAEIEFDGVPYIFDPQQANQRRREDRETNELELFKITHEEGAPWMYFWPGQDDTSTADDGAASGR